MKWTSSLLVLVSAAFVAEAQDPAPASARVPVFLSQSARTGVETGDRRFPNFIGFISNPVQSIDPRSLNEIWPVFASTWVGPAAPLPAGNFQLYGAGLNVALTDRLSLAATQGGYAISNF